MSEFKQRPVWGTVVQSVALVAALFTFAVSIMLIADHVKLKKMDPLNDPVLLELREELGSSTEKNEALAEQIRTYDLYARRAYFGNQEQRRAGGVMVLLGSVTCFVALKLSWFLKPKLPAVGKPERPDHWELNALFRQLMAGTGIFLVVISLFLSFTVQSDLAVVLAEQGRQDGGDTKSVPQASSQLSELRANWPSLRGWGNIGVAQALDYPVSWDIESGDGILWTADVPVHGFNSPIVWGDRLFFTGGDEEGFEVFCFDANSGEELWMKTIETSEELPEVSEDTGFAAATMATDGQLVFAIFASGDLAAVDFEGNLVWQKNLGVPDNPYGMGSSLLCDGQRLFVQYDHSDAQTVLALSTTTGEPVWERARTHISWSSPSLIETPDGMQLVLNDEELVTGYDPATGKQLWQVQCLGGEVAPSPAFNGTDVVFVGNEYAQASAIKLTGGGAEILWQYDEYLPEIASPVAGKDRYFIATTAGDIVCLDAENGEPLWEQEFDDGFNSSPVLVGAKIYAVHIGGMIHVFDAHADTYHEIAAIDMGEPVYATPAFVNNRIYIRGDETLYCIGKE